MSYAGPMHPHALVLEDFQAKLSTELTVKKGEHVFLIWTYNDGWYVCNSENVFGCVPNQILKPDGYGQLKTDVPPIKFPDTDDEHGSETEDDGDSSDESGDDNYDTGSCSCDSEYDEDEAVTP
ncbi:hypothetical protein F4776DRAFT_660657 [Hypoxylon sp. NC0597]|nr:hypothetical protein F4776DRAFT_660657 [Hypoxylon sp. NC0597]